MVEKFTPEAAEAVARLFIDESAAVFRSALRLTNGDRFEAEDLVQEAFQAAVLRWEKVRDLSPAGKRAWLRAFAAQRAVDLHRKQSREYPSSALGDLLEVSSAEHYAISRIAVERFLEIVGDMSEPRRTVAYLKFGEGWNSQEIAEHIGISQSTVHRHVRVARETLVRALTISDIPIGARLAMATSYLRGDAATEADPADEGRSTPSQEGQGSGCDQSADDNTGGGSSPGHGDGIAPGEPPVRFLTGRLPERAPSGRRISLIAQVTVTRQKDSTSLRPLDIPPEGCDITLTVSAPGLGPIGDLEQELHVPAAADSEPIRFGFITGSNGLHPVTLSAFVGGTFLGELVMQVSVEVGASMEEGPAHLAILAGMAAEPGEVTLQVSRTDDDQYSFQLIGLNESG